MTPVLQTAARAVLPQESADPWMALIGFRANAEPERRIEVEVGDVAHVVALDGAPPSGNLAAVADGTVLFLAGEAWSIARPRPDHATGGHGPADGAIVSPMPGRIVSVDVVEGMNVAKGQKLLVLEAMKMEQAMLAPLRWCRCSAWRS